MIQITTDFLRRIFGSEPIKGNKMLQQRFEQVLCLYKGTYPSMKSGDHSLPNALSAMGFVLNAEVYFNKIESTNGQKFFLVERSEFLRHYNFDEVIGTLQQGNKMLFLYERLSTGKRKISSHGVIGKFYAIEHFYYYNNPYRDWYSSDPEANLVVVRLELENKGIIDLPVVDVAYFGSWDRKMELIL